MPFDGSQDDVESDFAILEAIGEIYDAQVEGQIRSGALQKAIRRWLVGHRDAPEDDDDQINLMAMAADLELFTPSMSGKTAFDRYLDSRRPQTDVEREAFAALRRAQFHLVRIVERDGDDLVRLQDLATQDHLSLLDSRISPLAAGALTAMRLCPLASGRRVLISPLFMIDETMLATAMAFVRPGKPLGNGHRCAANLYRDVARRDFRPMPQRFGALDVLKDLTETQRLALQWVAAEGAEEQAELTAEIRRAACLDNLVDVFGWLANALEDGPEIMQQALTYIAEILMETLAQRAQAGVSGYEGVLDRAGAQIAGHIRAGLMGDRAGDLFNRLRAPWTFAGAASQGDNRSAANVELDGVVQRIRALRDKTVAQGCTEQEAMAAAAKVAELLDRYDLSLDEIAVRKSDCAGEAVETNRRRRAPVDDCVQPVATFCDCRAWSEDSDTGALRYVFFGLKADVEAARLLHDLIEATFETETAAFRENDIYLSLQGGGRRTALNSFQIGLASGIRKKLAMLKSERLAATAVKTTGFDLVAVKHAVVDEEIEKLGLHFTTKSTSARRRVLGDAYKAGQATGLQFQPHPSLSR